MQDTSYYATRKRTYLEIAKAILPFSILLLAVFVLRDIQEAQFLVRFISKYICGILFILAIESIFHLQKARNSLYHPAVRITDEFLIMSFDKAVWPWDDIKNVKIDGSSIQLTIKGRWWLWNTDSESLSYVPRQEELVQTLVTECEKRGIPYKTDQS